MAKQEYLESILVRYRQAARREKQVILDEFCLTGAYNRKRAIRRLRPYPQFTKPRRQQPGRKPFTGVCSSFQKICRWGARPTPNENEEGQARETIGNKMQKFLSKFSGCYAYIERNEKRMQIGPNASSSSPERANDSVRADRYVFTVIHCVRE